MKNLITLSLATWLVAGSAIAAAPKLICTAANKEVSSCCCEMKNGKSHCKLTGKTFNKCCCVPKETAARKGR